MDFESDPAADFLNREREELAGIINDSEDPIFSPTMSNEDFELINSEIQQAQNDDLVDDLQGMSFNSTIPTQIHEVPEKIRLWREEMARKLEEKDRIEEKEREALKLLAQKEMSEWVTKYAENMEKTKSLNRQHQSELSPPPETTDAEAKNMWESISSLCDFSSAKGPRSAKDATRMRSIFLQMKASPKVN